MIISFCLSNSCIDFTQKNSHVVFPHIFPSPEVILFEQRWELNLGALSHLGYVPWFAMLCESSPFRPTTIGHSHTALFKVLRCDSFFLCLPALSVLLFFPFFGHSSCFVLCYCCILTFFSY